jgi:hypothetical protein
MAATTSSPVAPGPPRSPGETVDGWIRRIRETLGHDKFALSADEGKLHVTESPCHACDGAGSILLLVSRRPCRRCGGTGVFLASLEFPLSDARVERFCRSLRERQA